MVLYLFTAEAEQRVINLPDERRAAVAALRYQYARHLANPRFDAVVARLLAASAEARTLWQEYALATPPLVHRTRSATRSTESSSSTGCSPACRTGCGLLP
jgi:hypothetical protein